MIVTANVETTGFQDFGLQRLQAAHKRLADIHVVHYLCGSFDGHETEPTPIRFIAVKDLVSEAEQLFDATRLAELPAIEAFSKYVADRPNALWLNWAMRNEKYGFEAISRRSEYLGGSAFAIPSANRLDLSETLKKLYGKDFAPHPRLPELAKANGLDPREYRNGEQEVEAWDQKRYGEMRGSLQRKVRWIENLFRLQMEDKLNLPGLNRQMGSPSNTKSVAERRLDGRASSVDWRDLQNRLIDLVKKGTSYTNQKDLGKRLRCSSTTINKAINDSAMLTAWMKSARQKKTKPRAQSFKGVVADGMADPKAADPSDVLTDGDVDIAMRELIKQAKDQQQRAELNSATPERRRELARLYIEQRDELKAESGRENRLLGRRA